MKAVLVAGLLALLLTVAGPFYVVSVSPQWGGRGYAGRQRVCWASRAGQLPPAGCASVAWAYWHSGERVRVITDGAGRVVRLTR